MSAEVERLAVAKWEDDDDLVHVVCCNPHLADCGTDVTTSPWQHDDTEPTCPICAISDAEGLPCAEPDCPYREGAVS